MVTARPARLLRRHGPLFAGDAHPEAAAPECFDVEAGHRPRYNEFSVGGMTLISLENRRPAQLPAFTVHPTCLGDRRSIAGREIIVIQDALVGRSDGVITIAGKRDGVDVVIRVADNGPGISRERIDKIFEPFFTTKPIGAGTGLGLYVSYNMAVKQGGDLTAANRPEGGAEFTLRIPFDERQTG
jgi:phosphoglycerate-specific signal transduction histidine kinase